MFSLVVTQKYLNTRDWLKWKHFVWQMSQLPPEYDDIQSQDYDSTFTADISKKMRMPDRIIPMNGFRTDPLNGYHDDIRTDEQIRNQKRAASMNVPDKIVMGGTSYVHCMCSLIQWMR